MEVCSCSWIAVFQTRGEWERMEMKMVDRREDVGLEEVWERV